MNKIIPIVIVGVIAAVIIGLGSGSLSDTNTVEDVDIIEPQPNEVSITDESGGKNVSLKLSDSVSMREG